MPAVIYSTIKELGFDNFTIKINNRKILNGFFEELLLKNESIEIMRIIDKLDKIGENKVIECLEDLGIESDKISKIMSFIKINGSVDEMLAELEKLKITNELFNQGLSELSEVINYVKLVIPESYFKIDLTIARGLDYYTGTVYETFLNDYRELGSICSGGRYDNLADFYTDKKLPGVGISIGLTRLFSKLSEMNLIQEEKKSISKVLVVSMSEKLDTALKVCSIFRDNNINSDVYLENKKIKAKFKYADKLQIPYVAVIGEEEEKNETVSLKNMETGEQQELTIEEAIKILTE